MKKLLVLLALLYADSALSVDVNGELKKAQLEKLASDPTSSQARIYFNTVSNTAKMYDGTTWSSFLSGATASVQDSVFNVVDNGDATKKAVFELSGETTGKTATLSFANANNATYSYPAATDTLTGRASTDTLTNKDVSATSNTYRAASASQDGAVTTGSQTFAGLKTFNSGINLGNETISTYREGTFTPSVSFASGTVTFSNDLGVYTKIGRNVCISIRLTFTKNTISGNWNAVGNLPFTSVNITSQFTSMAIHVGSGVTVPANKAQVSAYLGPNTTGMDLRFSSTAAAAETLINATDLSGTVDLVIAGCYPATTS